MKRFLVIMLLLIPFTLMFADFKDAVVQIYTKLYVRITLESTKVTVTYVDGKEIDKKVEKTVITEGDRELWVMGSGSVIFSGKNPFTEELETLILTNYHVISFVVEQPEELTKLTNDLTLAIYERKGNKLVAFKPKQCFYRYKITKIDGPYLLFYRTFKKRNKMTFEVPCKVDKYDSLLDVAILKLENVYGIETVKLAESVDDFDIGTELYIFGAPLGIPFQLTRGILGQKHLDIDEGWLDMLRYDVPQAPGSSGSAIFEVKSKQVIGIVRGSFVNYLGAPYDGQHLGIAIDNIRDWMFYNGYMFVLEENENTE